jgi:hypothetical protein
VPNAQSKRNKPHQASPNQGMMSVIGIYRQAAASPTDLDDLCDMPTLDES